MKLRFFALSIISAAAFTVITHASWSQTKASANSNYAASAERKLQFLQSNGEQAHPDSAPTMLTEREINAYFASGNVKLPEGVQSVTFQEQPGVVVANSRVDFDQLKAGKNSYNPLLSVFSGLHDVIVAAHAYGTHGQGLVHVDSVSLDGVEVPRFALELFAEKYLTPKYPDIGLDSHFALPSRLDAATLGLHEVILTQK